MKTISIINLKGGVAKTITSVVFAYILTTVFNYRVLVIDNDKQGNASKYLNCYSTKKSGTAEVMVDRHPDMKKLICHTEYKGLDIIPANMKLLEANLKVQLDQGYPQQNRIRNALAKVRDDYDFCIIDNAPDINISTINALVASDEVIIPIKIDDFALEGMQELTEQIQVTQEELNKNLKFLGCLITQYDSRNAANVQGAELLREEGKYPVFKTHIRRSEMVDRSTFARVPVYMYSRRSAASIDYLQFTKEYLKKSRNDGAKGKHHVLKLDTKKGAHYVGKF